MKTLSRPNHQNKSHFRLTASETRIWTQYQLTPNKKQVAEILGYKESTVERVIVTVREKLRAQ